MEMTPEMMRITMMKIRIMMMIKGGGGRQGNKEKEKLRIVGEVLKTSIIYVEAGKLYHYNYASKG